MVHLYQPFGAKLEVFLAISQMGQSDVSMVAIGWLLGATCCQCDGHRVAGLNAKMLLQ